MKRDQVETSEEKKDTITEQWRKLGFFYDVRNGDRLWFLSGSKEGLVKFYDILVGYVRDPQYDEISTHEHYGPYKYLEIMTWTTPGIDSHSIHGRKEDLQRLADIFLSKLKKTPEGQNFFIGSEYAGVSEYSILVEIKEKGFDPALLDR